MALGILTLDQRHRADESSRRLTELETCRDQLDKLEARVQTLETLLESARDENIGLLKRMFKGGDRGGPEEEGK